MNSSPSAASAFLQSFDRAVSELSGCVAPWAPGYRAIRVSLLAFRDATRWQIITGQIVARTGPIQTPPRAVESPSVIAFQMDFEGGLEWVLQQISQLRSGRITFGDREFTFPTDNSLSGQFEFLNPLGLGDGRRLPTLKVYGGRRSPSFDRTRIDWELKGGALPYDGLAELVGEIGIPFPDGDTCNIEIVFLNVVELGVNSRIEGKKAIIEVLMPRTLDPVEMRIGYKVLHHRNLAERSSKSGDQISWEIRSEVYHGRIEIDVPEGSVLQTFVSYHGATQQQYWIADANSLPNPRRSAYSLFDVEQEVLRDFLFETSQPRKNAQHDFEDGVAILLFMLGFITVNLGGIPRLQEAPDLLCCTPSGDYAVVECTTGHPDRDDKLSKLFTRAQGLRTALDKAGLHQKRLLSVLTTTMSRNNIPATELDKATQMRIAVVCREDLESALQRSNFGESAERLYQDTWATLEGSGQMQLTPGVG